MALILPDLTIPPVAELFPTTRRWRKVRPCGTPAAYRRHYRRHEKCPTGACYTWHRKYERARRARKQYAPSSSD